MKTPSGKFVLRLDSELHGRLARQAEERGLSLNRLCLEHLKQGLLPQGTLQSPRKHFAFLDPILSKLKSRLSRDLVGVLVFGSQLTGRATASSDLDLLVVLDSSVPLSRTLYRWWDDHIDQTGPTEPQTQPMTINPQFVHVPKRIEDAGGLWLEVSQESAILWERNSEISRILERLQKRIMQDKVRRYWSNGLPYWVRNNDKTKHT